jgi:glycine/D-amino acid oxidase-like deaminating enzyme
MYITAEHPTRTIRSHPYKSGEILIFGGESHKMTKDYDKDEHYNNLIKDVKNKFAVDSIVYRWIAGDVMPNDRMPYIGNYPNEKNIFIITGFQAWGLAWAMVAAELIKDAILGRSNPLQPILTPSRIK